MARADDLAKRFETANNDLIKTIEGMTDEQWRAATTDDGRPAGVVAHHIASSHQPIAGLAQGIGTGQQMPAITMDQINAGNADHAKQNASCTREETLALLRSAGPAAASTVRGLSDEQLDRTATVMGGPMSSQQSIENILIGHVTGHLEAIRNSQKS